MASFVVRHDLWSREQHMAADRVAATAAELGIEVIRFAFADAHGVLRGKTLVRNEALRVLRDGVSATTTMLLKDLAGRTAFPVYTAGGGFDLPALQGAADMVLVPDPTTFRVLPWAPHTGWVLCDIFFRTALRCRSRRGRCCAAALSGWLNAGLNSSSDWRSNAISSGWMIRVRQMAAGNPRTHRRPRRSMRATSI